MNLSKREREREREPRKEAEKFIAQFLSPQIRPANPSSKYTDNVFYICTFSGLILKINKKNSHGGM